MRVVLPGEADATENLDRGISHRCEPPGERLGPQGGQPPLFVAGRIGSPQRMNDASAGELHCLVHVDAQMLDGLEAADRLAELLSHLGVFDGHVHHCSRGTESVSGIGDQHVVYQRLDRIR